jgi:hypothetical protein
MDNRLVIPAIVCSIVLCSLAIGFQPVGTISEPPFLQWEKTYGYSNGVQVIQTTDNGFLVAGIQSNYSISDPTFHTSAMLIKTDQFGSLEWQRSYLMPNDGPNSFITNNARGEYIISGISPIDSSRASTVFQTFDGGYILAGVETWKYNADLYSSAITGGDLNVNALVSNQGKSSNMGNVKITNGRWTIPFLMKTDSEGNVLWNKTYLPPPSFDKGPFVIPANAQVRMAIRTSDEGYLLAGTINDQEFLWVIKTDSLGNEQWNKIYDIETSPSNNVELYYIGETSDGYVISAHFATYWFLKTDFNGNITLSQAPNETNSAYNSFLKSSNGQYIWVGFTRFSQQTVGHILTIDLQGNVELNKTYPSASWLGSGTATSDGGFVLFQTAGYLPSTFTSARMEFFKIDASANFEWSKPYGVVLDSPSSILALNDGAFVVTGAHLEGVPTWKYDSTIYKSWVLLAKTLPLGTGFATSEISLESPQNKTYSQNNLTLQVAINDNSSFAGYSLDSQPIISVNQNTSITGLSAGTHSLTVFATNQNETTTASAAVYFTVTQQIPAVSPTVPEFPIQAIGPLLFIFVGITALAFHFSKEKKASINAQRS